MRWPARGNQHRRGHGGIFRGQKIVSSYANEIRPLQVTDKIIEPIFVRAAVGVRERYDLANSCLDSRVASSGKAKIRLLNVPDCRKSLNNLLRVVRRTVIDENNLVIRIVEVCQRFQAGLKRSSSV